MNLNSIQRNRCGFTVPSYCSLSVCLCVCMYVCLWFLLDHDHFPLMPLGADGVHGSTSAARFHSASARRAAEFNRAEKEQESTGAAAAVHAKSAHRASGSRVRFTADGTPLVLNTQAAQAQNQVPTSSSGSPIAGAISAEQRAAGSSGIRGILRRRTDSAEPESMPIIADAATASTAATVNGGTGAAVGTAPTTNPAGVVQIETAEQLDALL